ncbi:MAG: phosphoribosyltransferase family protein [Candidatus Omnitrophota bacterium]
MDTIGFWEGCRLCAFTGKNLYPANCWTCANPEINTQGWVHSLGIYYARCQKEYHTSPWSQAVIAAKRHCRPVVESLGRIFAYCLSRYLVQLSPCLITNVPGFYGSSETCLFPRSEVCTTQLLLAETAKNLKGDGWHCAEGLLTQVGRKLVKQHCCKSASQRRRNVSHIYAVPEPERVKGKNVILLDDVFTSGSTLSECANALLGAGVANVVALTLARTARKISQKGGGQ